MRFVALFAWARLRHRPARWLLVALGVATATVLPVLAENSATIVAAQAVRYGVAQLDPDSAASSRPPTASAWPPTTSRRSTMRYARQLARCRHPAPAELLFGQLSEGAGSTYFLGAADDLTSAVLDHLRPRARLLHPARCEVVVLGSGTPRLSADLGLVIVGRAVRNRPAAARGTFDPRPRRHPCCWPTA